MIEKILEEGQITSRDDVLVYEISEDAYSELANLFDKTTYGGMFMGNMLFDFILHPAFVVFVLIALFAAVVALVIAHRQKQLSAGLKAILISVVVLCVLYLLFMVSLVFLFDSSPPAPPVPYTP